MNGLLDLDELLGDLTGPLDMPELDRERVGLLTELDLDLVGLLTELALEGDLDLKDLFEAED